MVAFFALSQEEHVWVYSIDNQHAREMSWLSFDSWILQYVDEKTLS